MKRNEQTTAIYPGNYVAPYSGTPFPEMQPPRHTVVQADNKASEPRVLVIAYAVLFLVGGLFAWSVRSLTGWSLAGVSIVILPVIAALGFILFLAANGDWLAWREVVNIGRNQRLAILEHADLLRNGEDHRHLEAMRSLDIQEAQVQIDGRLQALQHQIEGVSRRLLMVPTAEATVTPPQYVAADPDKARAHTVAQAYAISLYRSPTRGGTPHPERVHVDGNQPGKIKGITPFSARGRWPDHVTPEIGKRARDLLFEPDRGQPPVIVSVAGGYALNLDAYPTVSEVWQKFG